MLNILSCWASIISFLITFVTFFISLNIRSKIIHIKERERFKKEFINITARLNGYLLSLKENNLLKDNFLLEIDIYMVDLTSRFTFLRFTTKMRCRYISYIINHKAKSKDFKKKLIKHLTKLTNILSKED